MYTKKLEETSGIPQGIPLESIEYMYIQEGIFCCDPTHMYSVQYNWVMESAYFCCLLDCQMCINNIANLQFSISSSSNNNNNNNNNFHG